MIRVFIGWDAREAVAFHVLCHSILTRASGPVSITPLVKPGLPQYVRKRDPTESTDFSLTRFLVPHLCAYEGRAIFMDCDMLCRVDLYELVFALRKEPGKALWCVKHDYTPSTKIKMDGRRQTAYPRKNWSSFMVFENRRCRKLTSQYVNNATGLALHRFAWLEDDEIGALPPAWNHLVGEFPPSSDAKILHYTLGGPWFPQYVECDHADEWFAEATAAGLGRSWTAYPASQATVPQAVAP